MAALRSIHESEKAIRQSDRIGALTSLATFYIPLSFVSSVFGMNVMQISSQETSIALFFAIAIPLTALSMMAVANWKTLIDAWDFVFSKWSRKDGSSRRTRWKSLADNSRKEILKLTAKSKHYIWRGWRKSTETTQLPRA
ncbi:hypothetical protein FNYG_15014 [Fusarium nygamai]|uniref:Uncharacterized protein n=1 Tax=Gibberella nygamai TaxID=42673 RepID=A0A2K0ULY3_GIBNY|nr:hypothetical protein FNYG_15014 [Fusarium nygamai]